MTLILWTRLLESLSMLERGGLKASWSDSIVDTMGRCFDGSFSLLFYFLFRTMSIHVLNMTFLAMISGLYSTCMVQLLSYKIFTYYSSTLRSHQSPLPLLRSKPQARLFQ